MQDRQDLDLERQAKREFWEEELAMEVCWRQFNQQPGLPRRPHDGEGGRGTLASFVFFLK